MKFSRRPFPLQPKGYHISHDALLPFISHHYRLETTSMTVINVWLEHILPSQSYKTMPQSANLAITRPAHMQTVDTDHKRKWNKIWYARMHKHMLQVICLKNALASACNSLIWQPNFITKKINDSRQLLCYFRIFNLRVDNSIL